jgi:cellulose synthase/poly-beta-1,6-N-acetylglucosamine synthase-like glycosyltransferase
MIILTILLSIIYIYIGISVMYAFVFSIAGKLGRIKPSTDFAPESKFAVMIPTYKSDEVILSSAKDAVMQKFPKDCYDVIVIADSLQPATIEELKQIPAKVIEVSFEQSTKAKSLNKAFDILPQDHYDYVLILDADNHMSRDFLSKINSKLYHSKAQAIQGHRVAKNLNTNFAILDAISEEVNNHIYRKGHRVLGLSSGLIGSGMAFDYSMYKEVLKTIHAVGGFDKESELKLLKQKVKIEYAEDALLYDEKVENSEVFGNQRRRWISAQLHYFKKFFLAGIIDLITKGNIDFFDKAFQQFLLPRVILLGSLILFTGLSVISSIAGIAIGPSPNQWLLLLVGWSAGILLAIPNNYLNKKTFKAIAQLPKAILVMFATLFKLKGANKKFIHTPHRNITSKNNP